MLKDILISRHKEYIKKWHKNIIVAKTIIKDPYAIEMARRDLNYDFLELGKENEIFLHRIPEWKINETASEKNDW